MERADRPRQVLVVAVAVAAVVFGYLGLGQAGSARTLGKRLVGLRPVQVVRMPDGGLRLIELRIGVAVLRQAAHVLDLPLGFLWRDRFHRTVADAHQRVRGGGPRRALFEHERFLDRNAVDEPEWWLCKQADDTLWRP